MSENNEIFAYYSTFRFNSVIIFLNDCESIYYSLQLKIYEKICLKTIKHLIIIQHLDLIL